MVTRRLSFQRLLPLSLEESTTSLPGLLHFILVPYFIILRVKQGGVKYHFLSFRYDSTWDGIPVSRTTSEHSTHMCFKSIIPIELSLLFHSISIHFDSFNNETWFIFKYWIVIVNIFWLFHCLFEKIHLYFTIIIFARNKMSSITVS